MEYKLYNRDCLDVMEDINSKSIDMILCDLPYGITSCKWDIVIPFDKLWAQYERIIKDNGAIVLFGDEPFTSLLITSNIKKFRNKLTWNKEIPTGFLNAKKMPLKVTEDICIFYKKLPTYNPQMIKRTKEEIKIAKRKANKTYKGRKDTYQNTPYRELKPNINPNCEEKYPTNLIKFNRRGKECNTLNRCHPTQKPVDLLEYLIKTYTNEGEVVLDNCMGSGSTGVACVNTNRNFIGIEINEGYFNTAKIRIEEAYKKEKKCERILDVF